MCPAAYSSAERASTNAAAQATQRGFASWTEMRAMLGRLGKIEPGQDLWAAMQDYMSWENLEERWAGPGRLDPKVLDYLRQQAGS